MGCEGIFQGQLVDCDNPLAVGLEQRIFSANKVDVLSVDYSVAVGEENVVELITMKPDKAFFEIQGFNETIKAQNSLIKNALSNTYMHQVDASIFEVDNSSLLNLQKMAYQPQIVIVFGVNDSSLGNGVFRLYGAQAGLDLTTDEQIHGDAETGGAQVIQLQTPDSGRAETQKPPVIWTVNYETTLAMIEALLIPIPAP